MSNDAADLLRRVFSWHINSQGGLHELRELREEVVVMTGRIDLAEIPSDDIGLHAKLIDAMEDWMG